MARQGYTSTSSAGLNMKGVPWRLYEKAKRFFWNPADIDFTKDLEDWKSLTPREQENVMHLATLFMTGEEAVTIDILPLIQAVAGEGRLEETMFLTTFAMEEAKHIEFFRRFFDAMDIKEDLTQFAGPNYNLIFDERLPQALGRLGQDPSPVNQARAAVTYNHVVEGVLALTGYHAWSRVMVERGIFPGLGEGLAGVQRDERRHMAYGTFLCRRLVAADESIWGVVQEEIGDLTEPALGLIDEGFERYGDETPFGISKEDLMAYAMTQFPRRLEVIEAALGKTVEEVEGGRIEEQLEDELAQVE